MLGWAYTSTKGTRNASIYSALLGEPGDAMGCPIANIVVTVGARRNWPDFLSRRSFCINGSELSDSTKKC